MTYLKFIIGVVVAVCVLFFLLGLKSQRGIAKGLMSGKLADCPSSPNCACSEADVQPERSVEPLDGSLTQAKAAIISLGGVITAESDEYVSATFMSKIFKFVDDVELRPGPDGKVHIRSASRVGYSDRGANQKRVSAIRERMSQSK